MLNHFLSPPIPRTNSVYTSPSLLLSPLPTTHHTRTHTQHTHPNTTHTTHTHAQISFIMPEDTQEKDAVSTQAERTHSYSHSIEKLCFPPRTDTFSLLAVSPPSSSFRILFPTYFASPIYSSPLFIPSPYTFSLFPPLHSFRAL
jgi:hypothetical protein